MKFQCSSCKKYPPFKDDPACRAQHGRTYQCPVCPPCEAYFVYWTFLFRPSIFEPDPANWVSNVSEKKKKALDSDQPAQSAQADMNPNFFWKMFFMLKYRSTSRFSLLLTLFQTTNLRLFQTELVCRRLVQFG